MRRTLTVAIVAATACLSSRAWGDTEAYWRHEEGPAGAVIAAGDNTVADSSGKGNHMKTFDPVFTSADYTTSVAPLALRNGLANNLALKFGPDGVDEDRFRDGLDDDNFAPDKPLSSHLFTGMSVELAFNMGSVGPGPPGGGYQALVGKDGQPSGGPAPPFKVLVRADDFPDAVPNQLFIEWFDGDNDLHFVNSGVTLVAGQWYHLAFTLSATDAQMWLATGAGPYALLDTVSSDFAGAGGEVLVNTAGTWTVGRGMFGNGITDWANAIIDEVRISDEALAPGQFLFVPEPAGWTLAALAACACGRLRRRR